MIYGNYLKVENMPADLRARAAIVKACVEEIKADINANCNDVDWSTMEVFVKDPSNRLSPFDSEIDDDGNKHEYWTVGVKVKAYEDKKLGSEKGKESQV